MMKKILLACVFSLTLASICLAQEEPQNFKWEIGFDAVSLLDRSDYPAYSVFVLRDLGRDWAFRGRLGFEGTSDANVTAPPGRYPAPNDRQSSAFFGSVGLQRQLINEVPNLYVGLDLGYRTHKAEHQLLDIAEGHRIPMYYQERDTRRVFQVSPFIGYGVPIVGRLTLRIETAFVWSREWHRYELIGYRGFEFRDTQPFIPPTFRTPTEFLEDARNINSYTFMPFSQVLLTFKL